MDEDVLAVDDGGGGRRVSEKRGKEGAGTWAEDGLGRGSGVA